MTSSLNSFKKAITHCPSLQQTFNKNFAKKSTINNEVCSRMGLSCGKGFLNSYYGVFYAEKNQMRRKFS